jgi:hypothetical protein
MLFFFFKRHVYKKCISLPPIVQFSHKIVDGLLQNVLLDCGSSSSRAGDGLGGRSGAGKARILGLGRRQKLALGFGGHVQRLAAAAIQTHHHQRNQPAKHSSRGGDDANEHWQSQTCVQLLLRLFRRRLRGGCKKKKKKKKKKKPSEQSKNVWRCLRAGLADESRKA